MSDSHDSNGQAEGASTWTPVIVLEAPQARAIAGILEAFETGDPSNPPCVQIWADTTNPDLTVTVHAGLREFPDPPDDDLEVCINTEGRIYGYQAEINTTRWLVPVRLDQPTAEFPYRGAFICYDSEEVHK